MDFNHSGGETEHSLRISAQHHYNHQQGAGSPAFAPYRHPSAQGIDSGLEQPQNNGRPQLSVHVTNAPHMIQDNATINPQHMPHNFYSEMSRSSITPSTPSNGASPRYTGSSPRQQSKGLPQYIPGDRSLPAREVTEDTIDEAYAAFILYCNPSFPASIDTSELIKAFRLPPRSDGKSFSTWHLYELIKKFDQKEIKTWTQLALELGVDPPSMEKGQSTQKVQQYSVRLKRWMRAMHIDAYFEYLVGNQHGYYTQIPPPENPFPENGRDGVTLEEDLALRALDSKLKPKRGRRKTEDADEEMEGSTPPPKRPQLDTSVAFGSPSGFVHPQSAYPQSALPMSAHPDDMDRYVNQDPWATAAAMTPGGLASNTAKLTPHSTISNPSGQHLRWRLNTQDNPTTPHPLSAVTPLTSHPPDSVFDEPQSATTPSASKSRSRRRHGPAVSSAWPSTNTTANGKLRGRPPSNRSVRDGPFVTFPANPKTKEGPPIDINRGNTVSTPIQERAHSEGPATTTQQDFRFPPTPASAVSMTSQASQSLPAPSGRPSRLHLQVPQHIGGPVHLVTPTLLLNGESENPSSATTTLAPSALPSSSQRSPLHYFEESSNGTNHDERFAIAPSQQTNQPEPSTSNSTTGQHINHLPKQSSQGLLAPNFETLKRALAADLLRADLRGRKQRLRGSEAKLLAASILRRLQSSSSHSTSALTAHGHATVSHLPTPHSASEPFNSNSIPPLTASWLGLSSSLGIPGLERTSTSSVKKIVSHRFRVSSDGYDSPIDDDDEDADGESVEPDSAARSIGGTLGGGGIREQFDISWTITLGSLSADVSIRAVGLEEASADVTEPNSIPYSTSNIGSSGPISETNLASRVEGLEKLLRERDDEIKRLREKVLDAVL